MKLEDFDFNFDYNYDVDQERGMLFNDEVKTVMVEELLQDGLIKSADDFSFELTKKSFKVNGKKQAAHVAKKYLELYESVSDQKMQENGNIKIENKNGRIKGSFRSSGLFRFDDFNYYSYLFLLTPETATLNKPCPKRLDGLESLSFLITPIEFKPG
jgi:antitoxin component YwqK of YwqJK toxin-antitoxin module